MEFIRKSQPTASDVHVNRPLTNLSVHYAQEQDMFVADRAFTPVPSEQQSNTYYEYDRGFFWRNEMEKRAEGTESKGVGYSVSTSPYFCDVYGLHHDISDRRRSNADANFDLDAEAVDLLTHQALIRREKDWANDFFTTSVWTGATNVGAGTQWNAASGSTPINQIRAGHTGIMQRTGKKANTLILPFDVRQALLDNDTIIDRIKFSGAQNPALTTDQILAQVFDVERILVGGAIENTAAEGATNDLNFILSDGALLLYVAPSAGLYTPSAGYTFVWTGLFGTAANGMRITRMRSDLTQSDRVEMEQSYDQKLVSADMGHFFENVLA